MNTKINTPNRQRNGFSCGRMLRGCRSPVQRALAILCDTGWLKPASNVPSILPPTSFDTPWPVECYNKEPSCGILRKCSVIARMAARRFMPRLISVHWTRSSVLGRGKEVVNENIAGPFG